MLRRVIFILVLACALPTFSLGVVSQSEAKDLTDTLGKALDVLLPATGETITTGASIAPAFAAAVGQAVTYELPLASIAPAFSYRYNPTVDIFERSTRVSGPLFSERALTLGERQLNFGISYSYVDFSTLNGRDLNDITAPASQPTFAFGEAVPQSNVPSWFPPLEPNQSLYAAPYYMSTERIRLKLQAHVIVPTLRYGLTDRWDLGIALPIVNTFLRVSAERVPVVDAFSSRLLYAGDAQGLPVGAAEFVDLAGNPVPLTQVKFVKSQRPTGVVKAAGHSTGIGDIALRSKYHFWRTEEGGASLGLALQLPTGEERDFHGTGETHLSTFLYLSQVFKDRVEPHLNIGVDFNADDVDRSSFVYAVGVSTFLGRQLGLVIDFLGRSEFSRSPVHFPITSGNVLNRPAKTCTVEHPCMLEPAVDNPEQPKSVRFPFFPENIKRNDIANFSFGLRYLLGESGSIFFGGIVPLNNDGFRADFIPSGGVEYTF